MKNYSEKKGKAKNEWASNYSIQNVFLIRVPIFFSGPGFLTFLAQLEYTDKYNRSYKAVFVQNNMILNIALYLNLFKLPSFVLPDSHTTYSEYMEETIKM